MKITESKPHIFTSGFCFGLAANSFVGSLIHGDAINLLFGLVFVALGLFNLIEGE